MPLSSPSTSFMHADGGTESDVKGNWLIFHLFLPADPQAYNVNSGSDRVPTIQVDLASPQSPDSVNLMDEFARAGQQQRDEDQGLMMKPSSGSGGLNKAGGTDGPREQQKLMRCLSDPGPSADEEEDEPFLPWWGCREVRLQFPPSLVKRKWAALGRRSIYFGSEPKKPKLLTERKKRAISLLSLLFIFLDRIVRSAAETEVVVHNVTHSGENYALPKVWTVSVSERFDSSVRAIFFSKGAVSSSNPIMCVRVWTQPSLYLGNR